jgi:primosomal protein N' (replication factor Y) (superfamily II helicase)
MAIAKVEPLTTARALRGPFDYRLPEEMDGVGVGSLLVVPFGRRRVLGVVVEVAPVSEIPPDRLAEPVEVHEAGVPDELVRLGRWAAREYCSTPARGLGLVLPPGTGVGGQRVRSRLESLVEATGPGRAAIANGARLGSRQRAVLEMLVAPGTAQAGPEGHATASATELAAACGADRATLRRLEARGLVRMRDVEVGRRPASASVGQAPRAVRLTAEQDHAVARIVRAMDGAGEGRELLLHGVTGSGKTEVYLAAAAGALERGRAAIVLVPEIGLTPQTVARFRDRFGDAVALLHSRLPAGARYDEWRRLRSGEARVCVGPRSAVFAPVSDLGLIVVDEEHDPSYKQEGDPRYDARHVARRRAAEGGAVLVAGSATPRPESWRGLRRLELSHRVDGRELPRVDVLDMRGGGRSGPLHARTREALQALRARGGKAILMLNRRGWAPHLSCRSCGHTWGCPDCDVSLVLHRRAERLACHHCGHAESLPESCPECGSVTLARHGAGTERLENLLAELVDPLPVFRLDSDSAARGGGHLEILRNFQAADWGVLLGTQMVAKGHDFADVVLSVLLDADSALRFPDFRAEERAFALVAQLAGRSGRGEGGGTVLVQTLAPDARAIEAASRHDTAGFLAGELERRRALRYPPFSHLVRVELAAAEVADAERAADEMRLLVGERLPRDTDLLGPAPRFRLRGRHRRQLLIKAAERAATVAAVRDAVESAASGRMLRGVSLGVDVDPQ